MKSVQAAITDHQLLAGDYRVMKLCAPEIARTVKPGQFVHILVPRLEGSVLRRPFSVFNAEGDLLSILYKQVGRGTQAMTYLGARESLSVVGPLGNGFPVPSAATCPVLVAGGYGVAPLYFLATRLSRKGVVMVGGARQADLLALDLFKALGWDLRVATQDGSAGHRGLVTDVLDLWLKESRGQVMPEFYACGPDGMLKAVGERAVSCEANAWLSLDKHMGCGVGACLACVQKIREASGEVVWRRVCRDGPVFEAREIVWNEGAPS